MQRVQFLNIITTQLSIHPICGLLGPRQVGKTTLARQYAAHYPPEKVYSFDLEDPQDVLKFDNPMILLTPLLQEGNLIIIDEIQHRPNLFPVLRVLVDNHPGKILILGSASQELIRQSSETLAGRIGYVELPPFSATETGSIMPLWLRGGFPRSYLAPSPEGSFMWRESYIKTFLERDIPSLGFNIPAAQMYRFWMMLCHYHGQTFNASEIARSLALTDHMVRKYLDILTGTFMIRSLQPWFENIGKRQVKAPKIYFRDSGVLHTLLGIHNQQQLDSYHRLGAFWEGFALEEVVRKNQARSEECFFWGTQGGAKLDLLLFKNGQRIGFEFKYSDAPGFTASMRSALEDLKLDHLYIIYPGEERFPLRDNVTVCGLLKFLK